MTNERISHCADCACEQTFVAVECFDGHDEQCCEFACIACGAAVLIDPPRPSEVSPATLPLAA